MTLSPLLEVTAEIALGHLVRRTLSHLERCELRPLLAQMEGVAAAADRQLLLPLKAGLTFLRLGDHRLAVEELVRAQAADEYAAVASFWLAVALAVTGREDNARHHLRAALALNPFLVRGGILELGAETPAGSVQTESTMAAWTVNVAKLEVGAKVGRIGRIFRKWRSRSAAVLCASTAGDSLVFHALLGSRTLPTVKHQVGEASAIGAVDRRGEWRWVRRCGEELILSSARVAVVRDLSSGRYRLIDLTHGQVLRDWAPEYFAVSFFPRLEHVCRTDAFTNAVRRFRTPLSAMEATTQPALKSMLCDCRGVDSELSEEAYLAAAGAGTWRVRNRWKHRHQIWPGASGVPTCHLEADGAVSWFDRPADGAGGYSSCDR